jgi:hypothetical protein
MRLGTFLPIALKFFANTQLITLNDAKSSVQSLYFRTLMLRMLVDVESHSLLRHSTPPRRLYLYTITLRITRPIYILQDLQLASPALDTLQYLGTPSVI